MKTQAFYIGALAICALTLGCIEGPSTMSSEQSVASYVGGDGGVKGDGAEAAEDCCVCFYGNDTDCTTGTGTCTDRGADCRVVDGVCEDRHLDECRDWMDQQTGCDRKIIQSRDAPPPDLSTCDTITGDDDGHGCGLDDHTPRIQACVSSGSCVNFQLEGCSEFDDLQAAEDWVNSFELEDGQTISITGNQCTSSDGCQIGMCTITATCDGTTTVDLPECGQECREFAEGETAQCGDYEEPSTEVCCCTGSDCNMVPGDTCDSGGGGEEGCASITDRQTCLSSYPSSYSDAGPQTSCGWVEPSGPCR